MGRRPILYVVYLLIMALFAPVSHHAFFLQRATMTDPYNPSQIPSQSTENRDNLGDNPGIDIDRGSNHCAIVHKFSSRLRSFNNKGSPPRSRESDANIIAQTNLNFIFGTRQRTQHFKYLPFILWQSSKTDNRNSFFPQSTMSSYLSLLLSYSLTSHNEPSSILDSPSYNKMYSQRNRRASSWSERTSKKPEFLTSVQSNGTPTPKTKRPKYYFHNLTFSSPMAVSLRRVQAGNGVHLNSTYVDTTSHSGMTNTFGPDTSRRTLRIGALFELSGKNGVNGLSELDAAYLAVSHINEQNVIPGYKLELLYNDSKCDPGVATDAFFDFIYRRSNEGSLAMVMGSACTEVTKTIAEIVPYWNLILISYAVKSPALSEREKYRTFFRLALGDTAFNPARRMLIKHFLWDKVAAIYEDLESFSLSFNSMNDDFSSHDIVIKSSTSFKDAALELPGKLKEMRDLDVRIIIAGFTDTAARQVFCEAYKQGMYGARYVWILVGGFKHQWWNDLEDTSCTQTQLAAAVEGIFTVFSPDGLLDGGKSVANLTSGEFLTAYFNANGSRSLSMFAASTYDTVWTIALTIRQAIGEWLKNGTDPLLQQLCYDKMGAVKETFISTMENLEFPGVSGPVSFKGSDREGIAVIYQVQGGNFTQVAIQQPTSKSLSFDCKSCHSILWQGGQVPRDEQIVVARLKMIELSVFYACTGLCIGGIILAVFFLTYNLYHGRLKYIKLSSPKLNNVAVIGCILVYTGVIILGFDDRTLTDHSFPIVCSARAFLLAAGFSLAFGAMFAKTFRVHQIFTRAHHGLVRSKLIQDTHLLVIIGVLLFVDSAMVFLWVVVDPMNRHVYNTTTEVSAEDEDMIFQEQLATCHSNHLQKWLGAFYAYKGLLLIFGVYMAWETRHVKIPALNDSQYIGLNVYNVVIMSVSVVVISNILSSQPTLAYAMEAAFMFLSTTVTLCLLFVPKIYAIVTSGGNPVIASMGIVVDNTNTRRFVFDDRKEIYYRAEVQNRVYKRELVELDQQIVRLERLQEIPLQPYPRLTEELLYLLPESKVDGTPRCHRRYKRELERCNSISDGGEGVTFDISENDDILMEMAFTSGLKPTPSVNKRHSSVETCHGGSNPLQKFRRSFSIGSSSARRQHRKQNECTRNKSPLPFSSTVSNFNDSRASAENDGVCRLGVHSANVNHYSDELTYLQKDKNKNSGNEHFQKNSSVPMMDKITQTISGSSCAGDVRVSVPGGVHTENETRQSGRNYEREEEAESVFLELSRTIQHSHLPNSKPEKIFSVQRLNIESTDDESNSASNCEDNDSVNDLTADHRDAIVSVGYDKLQISKRHNDTLYDDTLSLQNLYVGGSSERLQESPYRPRSISSPNPPTYAFIASTSSPLSYETQTKDNTKNATTVHLQHPVPSLVCLDQHNVSLDSKLNVSSDSVFTYSSSLPEIKYSLSSLYRNVQQEPQAPNGKNTSLLKRENLECTSQVSSFCTKENMALSSCSSACQASTSKHLTCPLPRPVCLSLSEGTIKPRQIYPCESRPPEISLTYASPEVKQHASAPYSTSSLSQEARSLLQAGREADTQDSSSLEFSGNTSAKLNLTKTILEMERRKRIQKLQDDLVRIQRELQDLNNLEFDVSDV